MSNFNTLYKNFIDDKNAVKAESMAKGKFYLIKEYVKSDGTRKRYNETNAPIVFVLYKSSTKDIVHTIKISNLSPNIVEKFFGNFINENVDKIHMKDSSKKIYKNVVSKIPSITDDSYRTYNLSGLNKIIELTFDLSKLLPNEKKIKEIKSKKDKK